MLSGARQCGKSTLARLAFPEYPVLNMDAADVRATCERMTVDAWCRQVPRAIIDEAQKLPAIFDTVKAAYDRDPSVRYLLLGSSQIRLLRGVRETLAGRVALRELFALTLPELATEPGEPLPDRGSLLCRLLRAERPSELLADAVLAESPLSGGLDAARHAWRRFQFAGGMPALWNEGWTDEDRFEWLRDYRSTYLERDLSDLARLDRIEPFARAQQAAALRHSLPLNASEIARLSGVHPTTAREYMHYLELSYQVVLLPPWFRNAEKRLSRQPRIQFLDPGVLRAILGRRGEPDGREIENAVVAEILKQIRTHRFPVEAFWLRTYDGREVDLLIEREDGYFAFEVKSGARVDGTALRGLRGLDEFLDKPILLSAVLSHDVDSRELGDGFWALEIPRLLG